MPRYAPPGVSSDAHLAKEMGRLLDQRDDDDTRAHSYVFHMDVPTSLHKGQVVVAKGTGRRGTLSDAPPPCDLLQPLNRHPLRVLWQDADDDETIVAADLTPSCIRAERQLSSKLRALVKTTPPFRATLDGTLATVEAQAHDSLHEIRAAMLTLVGDAAADRVGPIESPAEEVAHKARFYRTPRPADNDPEAQALADTGRARLHDARSRLRATVTNRKAYVHTLRHDPWWNQYGDENLALTQKRRRTVPTTAKRAKTPTIAPPCNAQQPPDLVSGKAEVIVPHWTTADKIHTYIRAEAIGLEHAPDMAADCQMMRVRHGTHVWIVALPHVHPVKTCQDVRRGSAVFVEGDGDGRRTASGAPSGTVRLAHIERIHQPNDALVCGWAGETTQVVRAPARCTAKAWTDALNAAFPGQGLSVGFVSVGQERGSEGAARSVKQAPPTRTRRGGARTSKAHDVRAVITCTGRARFCIAPASTAAPLLGFLAGRTYETTQQSAKGVYRLEAPHAIQPEDMQVRSSPLCEVVSVHDKTVQTLSLDALIPVRPQYSKERNAYKHLSTYQRFPVDFMTPERPQRGILLYHEMGAGKSRTAIEMAQRYLEDRYWAHHDAQKPGEWKGERPKVVLFSPTQEARTHFLKDEVPLWTACWWSREAGADNVWVPKQHVYTQRDPSALYTEMHQHEEEVRRYLWGQRQGDVYLSIVTDNTNNLYRVLKHVRTAIANKSITLSAKQEVLQYFGAPLDAQTFDINARTDVDEYYGRFFRDSFVIVDEMHRVCNAMVNTEASQGISGVGMFFYQALMEAPHCRLVGLSGTPMQRTAVAFAPLFNLLHGKTKVWTIGFKGGTSKQLQEDTYAAIRPLAATVWADHRQAVDAGGSTYPQKSTIAAQISFTAWPYPDVTRSVNTLLQSLRRNPLIHIDHPEYELFPFAFQQKRGRGKRYEVNLEPFAEHFIKHNRLQNPVDFAKRIVGLVSYVSPPKVTADQDPTLDAGQVYPQYAVRTCRLAMDPSHHAYLQLIHKRKREINQRQADVEERSGCNVNWGALKERALLDGREGLLKLFFKGGNQTLQSEDIDAAYHQLLLKVHSLCQTQDPRIAPYLRMNGQLQAFSPKMHRIVRSLRANHRHKAVVYSEFIDGVGGGNRHEPRRTTSNAQRKSTLDAAHVGFSGLGLLGYVLEANGYVRFELEATHVFHEVYRHVHAGANAPDARAIARAVGLDRRTRLTVKHLLDATTTVGVNLRTRDPALVARLDSDVDWEQTNVTLRDFGRWLAAETYGPHAKWLAHTRTRYALSRTTREGLGLTSTGRASNDTRRSTRGRRLSTQGTRAKRGSTSTPTFPPTYLEYGRCLANAPNSVSNTTKADMKDFVLRLYNLRSTTDVPRLDGSLTTEAQKDIRALLRNVPTGNAYGRLVQTLLASAKVTEAVEFKDVRAMHILEPPQDYRQLEQMFGRVIRRGSHPGVRAEDRSVTIRMYVMTMPYALQHVTSDTEQQAAARRFRTKDEQYWEGVIQRKYEISQDFYTLLKHTAVDCRANLVLNTASAQDKRLTCYEYPYQALAREWHDTESPLYGPAELASNEPRTRRGARVVHVPRAVQRA